MIHPCCGGSLQRGTKIIAIVDIVFGILALLLYILVVVGYSNDNYSEDEYSKGVLLAVIIIGFIISILGLILAAILLQGSNQRNLRKCKIWFIVSGVLLVINTIMFIVNVASGDSTGYDLAASCISILFRAYMLWVVHAFIQELRAETGGGF